MAAFGIAQDPFITKMAAFGRFSSVYHELQEELEALEAIYIHELEIVKNARDEVSSIILQLHPATGDDEEKKFVCMTLQLDPTEKYPDEPPDVFIRNPRGIGDEEIQSLLEDMHKLASERRGGPMLYELIELAKESLTVGNIPHCLCMICLEHFYEGEQFTRTVCYHYFHKSCLARYVQHFLSEDDKTDKKLTLYMNREERKIQCPVCREEISYDPDTLTYSPVEEKVCFEPTEEMKKMQAQMASMLEKQKALGGLIDVDAEKNKFLLKDDDVIHLPSKSPDVLVDKNRSASDSHKNSGRKKGEDNRDGRNDAYRKQERRRDKQFENTLERSRSDQDRPRSGFIRGKGRGNRMETRTNKSEDQKNDLSDYDKRKIGERKPRFDKESHPKFGTERQDTKPIARDKIHEASKLEKFEQDKAKSNFSKKHKESRDSEKKEELNIPTYDEKINDRLKIDQQKHQDERQRRNYKRSPRYSNRDENDSRTDGIEYKENHSETVGRKDSKDLCRSKEIHSIAGSGETESIINDTNSCISDDKYHDRSKIYSLEFEKHDGRHHFKSAKSKNDRMERKNWRYDKPNERMGNERRKDNYRHERTRDYNRKNNSKTWREDKIAPRSTKERYYDKDDTGTKNNITQDTVKSNNAANRKQNASVLEEHEASKTNQTDEYGSIKSAKVVSKCETESKSYSKDPQQLYLDAECHLAKEISESFEDLHIAETANIVNLPKNKQNDDTDPDNEAKPDPNKNSHPPGFHIGPPPGFKSAQKVLNPPPGF